MQHYYILLFCLISLIKLNIAYLKNMLTALLINFCTLFILRVPSTAYCQAISGFKLHSFSQTVPLVFSAYLVTIFSYFYIAECCCKQCHYLTVRECVPLLVRM